ncbi:two-component response regulator ARR2-like protein [Trifolium pratense]|uniref:Two-component response regulator ARR2-like protein n=1 Tax=Trifolium pratense TaxID=57577 RepID=A0A2K3PHP5_TRIPR|nr:two-component response regulator ARR2-like protein [Trifolium pratense]
MTLEKGATHFIVKPVCAEDFKDISMYVVEAKKHKLFIDNLFVQSEEQESSEQAKTKKEDSKRKNIDESQGEAKCKLVKKSSRLVWTDDLHNLFLDAIKKVGLKKAVPGKILELMNIPNLTRDNVASHLQKYRSFLDKVAEKELVGNASQRAFSSNIGSCVLNESPLSVNQNSMQMNENNDASAFLKSDLINSIQDVQSLDQLYKGGDDTSLVGNTSCVLNESPLSVNQTSMQFYKGGDVIASSSAEINSCMLNESPISLDQNSNQLQGYEQYSNEELYDMFVGDKMSEASTSATNPVS